MPRRETAVSCPGKVLIAGGYLVLDREYSGSVVATSSRFYTVVQDVDQGSSDGFEVEVRSPQFHRGRWTYLVTPSQEAGLVVRQIERAGSAQSPNKFVQLAVSEAFRLALANGYPLRGGGLRATVVGDNDFYSQPAGSSVPFQPLGTTIADVHKTGLGSSAAMTTSLVSALVLHLVPSLPSTSLETRKLLHNLAQYVHSLAQGKVGSGFDVSAAVWGSHGYRRFAESCLSPLLGPATLTTPSQLSQCLDPCHNLAWADASTAAAVEPFSLPPGTKLLLADVDAGSHTPSMVGKVLAWRSRSLAAPDGGAESQGAGRLWDRLASHGRELREACKSLNALAVGAVTASDYEECIRRALDPSVGGPGADFQMSMGRLCEAARLHRRDMKAMGEEADVPIEPDRQTRLLDACADVGGVLACGVPGAGGYDAVWVLVLDPSRPGAADASPSPEQQVRRIWTTWKEMTVKPLSDAACVVGGEQKEEEGGARGLRVVDVDAVAGLRSAVERTIEWPAARGS